MLKGNQLWVKSKSDQSWILELTFPRQALPIGSTTESLFSSSPAKKADPFPFIRPYSGVWSVPKRAIVAFESSRMVRGTLEVLLVSAKGLEDVDFFGRFSPLSCLLSSIERMMNPRLFLPCKPLIPIRFVWDLFDGRMPPSNSDYRIASYGGRIDRSIDPKTTREQRRLLCFSASSDLCRCRSWVKKVHHRIDLMVVM